MRRLLTIAAALFATFATQAIAQVAPTGGVATDLFETVARTAVTVVLRSGERRSGDMIISHFRPPGNGPFPLVVMNHGRAADAVARASPERFRFIGVVRYWVGKGYAVLVPTRLGYGATGVVPDTEESGPCDNRAYKPMTEAAAHQIRTAATFAATLPFVDASRIILMGQSVGGLATIIAAGKNVPGVVAAINVAGGSGGAPRVRPRKPCSPERLQEFFALAGKSTKVPTLWLYAENDLFWGADIPRRWHQAFERAGGAATFVMTPPVDTDGHKLLAHPAVWSPHVDTFIATLSAKGR